jgi:hypothetical protein
VIGDQIVAVWTQSGLIGTQIGVEGERIGLGWTQTTAIGTQMEVI